MTLSPLNDTSSIAFDAIFSRFNSLEKDKLLVYLIDSVDSSAFVHLAEQFHVMGNEGWIQCKTEAEQRQLIKNAIELHKYKGTKFALKKVLQILNLNGQIKEWFEYSGSPYHFMVGLEIKDRSYEQTTERQLLDLIDETKNVRSVLETLEVNLTSTAVQNIRSAIITSEEIKI